MKSIYLLLIASLLTMPLAVVAKEDVKGSSDHPLISRYPDFYINQYSQAEFDEARLMVGELDNKAKQAETITVEGKVTNIRYSTKKKHSPVSTLQLYKNYENALRKLGADFLLACRGKACFKRQETSNGGFVAGWMRDQENMLKGVRPVIHREFGILVATVEPSANKKVYVMIIVSTEQINGYRGITMSIVEPASLDIEKVGIGSPDDLKQAMEGYGKVVLDGIYFDSDKAIIKPESASTLEVIAAYLKANPASRFYVVGHTDNAGSYDHNLNLSKNRALAVLDHLVQRHGISDASLKAVGVGPVSPVASNTDKTGQAINRRVELVLAE